MTRVSILMPTFKQAAFIRRALESLRSQTFRDWELIVVDDASPDETDTVLVSYLMNERIRYHRMEHNVGLGAALNHAVSMATGQYIAYLPSDDVYYPDHLEKLVALLDANPDTYLAYGGVRWNYDRYQATLQGDDAVGREAEILRNPPPPQKDEVLHNGNLFALVQVMHRRDHEGEIRWQTRAEIVTDRLEPDYWRALLDRGANFAYTGDITCEWVDHPDQHHKIIADGAGGKARFRQFYNIGRGEFLNWQPSFGPRADERIRFGRFLVNRKLPTADGLKILIVGSLGFNPERIMALEERGHKLYGLWIEKPESWDTTGPLAYGHLENLPYNSDWGAAVQRIQPDVIYAMLNWQAIPLLYEVCRANLGIPFIFHFKEDPFICQEQGTWSQLNALLLGADGVIIPSRDGLEWFQQATDHRLDPERLFILDGDMPKIDWFTDQWAPKLSAVDGEVHTVVAGRIIGIDPMDVVEAGIHLHFYGDHFHQGMPNFIRTGLATGRLHLHETVDAPQWVSELSQYDAAWFHIFPSYNRGDLRRANRDDLNIPARLGTYAAAGLPWILKDNRDSRVAVQSLAQKYDVGIFFKDMADLGAQLRDRPRIAQLTDNMRRSRHQFAFDTHADDLLAFFRQVISLSERSAEY